jgi:N-methylhydantoinase A
MTASKKERRFVVATDVGGTCTDTVIFDTSGAVHFGKSLSTPPNFADGVLDSIAAAAREAGLTAADVLAGTQLFTHGSTVVDNTLLTRAGAHTGLITTEGFEDTIHVTRGAYGRWAGQTEDQIKHVVASFRPDPLVAMAEIAGVPERVDYKGEAIRDLDEAAVEDAVRHLVENRNVEAIAVCFLWSFYNDAHEKKVREIVSRVAPDTYVTLSSEIAPVPGEYERTSTTVINAYAGRIASDYLGELTRKLGAGGYDGPVLVMQGYGGLLPASEAAGRAVGMIESGPAAGIIGSKFLGDVIGDQNIIAADMGGTTFKVGVIEGGEFEYAREPLIDRFHYLAPKIDIVSIGAGGGSIVSLDPRTNVPRVGPQSAGALPGPVCYGRGGTEPTLTDVAVLVGYLDPAIFLSGEMTLDMDAARTVFTEKIAKPLGMSVENAAIGIMRIAAAQISDLIHEITVERGLDPRDFVLHAFGGTCPILCGLFGQDLNVKRIVVPYAAAVNCAFGLASSDIVHEYSTTKTLQVPSLANDVNAIFDPMIETAKAQLADEGFAVADMRFERAVDFRYGLQIHEVTTPVRGDDTFTDDNLESLGADFEALYERRYGKGSAFRDAGMEMTMFRLTARGLGARPEMIKEDLEGEDGSAALTGRRNIFVEGRGGLAEAAIYSFEKLRPGNKVSGPAVIHTPITTIVLQENQTGRLDQYRNMIIEFA